MNLDQLVAQLWEYKIRFVSVFFIIFTGLYGVLYAIDFLPEPVSGDNATAVVVESTITDEVQPAELPVAVSEPLNIEIVEEDIVTPAETVVDRPVSLRFESLDRTVTVLNPQSRSIAALDAALLEGVVRHPDSATLDQEGNVFILGHSSYLPNVINRNYQAFNGIQNLQWGDIITVTGEHAVYTYKVDTVYEAKASELFVPIADTGHKLTLATCDSFGSVDDRFIVEADLIETRPLAI